MTMNMLYYNGNQYAYWDPNGQQILQPSMDDLDTLRRKSNVFITTSNFIKPDADTLIAELSQRAPTCYIVPKTSGQRAKNIAKTSTDLWQQHQAKTDYNTDSITTIRWGVVCGQGYKWVHPDTWEAGTFEASVPNPDYKPELAGIPELPGDLKNWRVKELKVNVPIEVKVKISNLTPFEIFGPAGINKIDDWPELWVDRMMNRKVIEEAYHVKLNKGDDITKIGVDVETENLTAEKRYDMKELIEYFARPSHDFPLGRHLVICDGRIVHDGGKHPNWNKIVYKTEVVDNPEYKPELEGQPPMTDEAGNLMEQPEWRRKTLTQETEEIDPDRSEWGGYRIVQYPFYQRLESHWAEGFPQSMILLQRRYNTLLTTLYTNAVVMGCKKLLIPKEARLKDEDLVAAPCSWEIPTGAEKPSWLVTPPETGDIKYLIELIMQDAEKNGLSGLTTGNEPEQRMAGIAIRFLRETNLRKYQTNFKWVEEAEKETCESFIWAVKQYCPNYPFVVLGKNREFEIQDFNAADLDTFEVVVEPGSGIPESKAGQTALATEIIQYNAINFQNPREKRAWFNSLDSGFAREIVENMTQSSETAKAENRLMKQGVEVQVLAFQDHPTHIEEHGRESDNVDTLQSPDNGYVERRKQHILNHVLQWQVDKQMLMAGQPTLPPGQPDAGTPEQLPQGGE